MQRVSTTDLIARASIAAGAMAAMAGALPCSADPPRAAIYKTPEQLTRIRANMQKAAPVQRTPLNAPPSDWQGPKLTSGAEFINGLRTSTRDGLKVTQLNYTSGNTIAQVYDWYQSALQADGWKVARSGSTGTQPTIIAASKEPRLTFNVVFSPGRKTGCGIGVSLCEGRNSG